MEAYIPTMLTSQGQEYRDGIFSTAAPQLNYQESTQEFADGSLGLGVFQDGILGSLGAGAPRGPYYVNPLQAKLRLLRKRLGIQGLGAGMPRPSPTMGSNRKLEYLKRLKRLLSGVGAEEQMIAPAPPAPEPAPAPAPPTSSMGAIQVVGLLAAVGLGAYGIYRLTKKK